MSILPVSYIEVSTLIPTFTFHFFIYFIDWASSLADMEAKKHNQYELAMSVIDPLIRSQAEPLDAFKAAIDALQTDNERNVNSRKRPKSPKREPAKKIRIATPVHSPTPSVHSEISSPSSNQPSTPSFSKNHVVFARIAASKGRNKGRRGTSGPVSANFSNK